MDRLPLTNGRSIIAGFKSWCPSLLCPSKMPALGSLFPIAASQFSYPCSISNPLLLKQIPFSLIIALYTPCLTGYYPSKSRKALFVDQRIALQTAVEDGQVLMVEILLRGGSVVNTPPALTWNCGRTAVEAATERGKKMTMEVQL